MASLVTETQLVELRFVHALGPGHALNKSVHVSQKNAAVVQRALRSRSPTKWVMGFDSFDVKIQKKVVAFDAGLCGRLLLLPRSETE
jgi:hypothetical protein